MDLRLDGVEGARRARIAFRFHARELLRRLGRPDDARTAYRRALELVNDDAERRLLERRLTKLETDSAR
ncbi:MAG TPA: tetratricopeptide repeat protein [Solirubrobacterales bacterium]|nr:tetratricopeptide repeat protein [Solirubrobacterales bacterium]